MHAENPELNTQMNKDENPVNDDDNIPKGWK